MGFGNVSERRMQPPQIGVSVVVLALGPDEHDGTPGTLWMPLVKRVREPFLGRWALPGGSLISGKSLEQAAYEALSSTTDLRPQYLEQLYAFGDPKRSSSGLPMVSIAYWALVGGVESVDFTTTTNVQWFSEKHLPELAFDHRRIVDFALTRLRHNVAYPRVASRLIGERFTLAQLHRVFEAVTGSEIDVANFRRKMLASGQLEETGDKIREGRQRPAMVYRYRMQEHHDADALHGWTQEELRTLEDAAEASEDANTAIVPLMPWANPITR